MCIYEQRMNRDTRLMALALLLWGLGEGLFFYIQPLYIEQLGANPVQIGSVLSAASIVRAVAFIPAGVLADRLPRKRLMLGAWVLGPAAVLLMAFARTWQGLIPGLLLYAASAYCIPAINAYLAHSVGGRNVERTFTTVYAVHTVGGVISPALGGWLAGGAGMRAVYFASGSVFVLSAVAVVQLTPQPVPVSKAGGARWRVLGNWRFLTFAVLILLIFSAMYLGFPLTSNFLAEVRGWDVTRIGVLGSLQALGMTVFGLLLGRVGNGRRGLGLAAGQALVWISTLLLLMAGAFPLVGLAYVLRGAYQGCRSLTQARSTRLGLEGERGLLLGATETMIASAQIVAPLLAGWLYASDPALPLQVSLVAIPVALVLGVVGLPRP